MTNQHAANLSAATNTTAYDGPLNASATSLALYNASLTLQHGVDPVTEFWE